MQTESIVRQELAELGWQVADQHARRKADRRTVKVAVRLRRETTMSLAWIAERLQMGSARHLAYLLHRNQQETISENMLFRRLLRLLVQ